MPVLENDQIFERYRIVRWLGSGSAGESYEAEDRQLLRKVTLKLIHPWSDLPDSARRQFFREMQGISALNHSYLASVLDYGEIDGRLYVARRYVSSGSLLGPNGRLWFRPPLAVADAFAYAYQLAQALQYIHQHGYLHGSLTFSNVLVLRGPNVEQRADYAPLLIADIGLTNFVRRFGQPQVKTLPVSAAPEQLGRRARPASDQFALAVLLYFWLAGRPPYLGTPDEVEKLKLTETITPLSILNPGLTSEQDSLILRALTAYPENRHASVLTFTEALQASLTASPQIPVAPFSPLPEQEATPRVHLLQVPNEIQEATPSQSRPLPTIPSTEPVIAPFLTETESNPDSQPAALPTIPETPHIEEHALQTALAFSTNEEPSMSVEEAQPSTPTNTSLSEEEPTKASVAELSEAPKTAERPQQISQSFVEIVEAPASTEQPEQISESAVEQTETRADADEPAPTRTITAELPETRAADEQTTQDEVIAAATIEAQTSIEQTAQVKETATATNGTPLTNEDYPTSSMPLADKIHSAPNAQSAATNHVSPSSPCLLIASPYTDNIYEFTLTVPEITIGRARVSDLRLEQDNLTSRHHALLKREGERILIIDKHSSNGVYVNGQRIEAARGYELADGDHIGIGNYELIFRSALGKALSRASSL